MALLCYGLLLGPVVGFGLQGYLQGTGYQVDFLFNPLLNLPDMAILFCGFLALVSGLYQVQRREYKWVGYVGLAVAGFNWFGAKPEDLYLYAMKQRVKDSAALVWEATDLIAHYNHGHPHAKRPSTDYEHWVIIDPSIDCQVPKPWPPHLEALHVSPDSVWVSSDTVKIRLDSAAMFQGLIISQRAPTTPDCRPLADGLYWYKADPW